MKTLSYRAGRWLMKHYPQHAGETAFKPGCLTPEATLLTAIFAFLQNENSNINTSIALEIEFNQFDAVNPSIALITAVYKTLSRLKVLFIVLHMFITTVILNLLQ